MAMHTKTIKVRHLARVEGEGGLHVRIKQNKVREVRLNIFEPPRFFEALLRGRDFREAPDITARICGICPVAYQMSSTHALEQVCGVQVGGALRELRRLLYCGEWIESHVLHVFMLHAPDFLGCDNAIEIARAHPELVKQALRMKKIGNAIVTLVGGREIHPINVRVGGFYRVPPTAELEKLIPELEWGCAAAEEFCAWTAGLDFPEFTQDYEFVALEHPEEYPFNEGRIVSNKGLNIDAAEFYEYIEELHVPHSTALHAALKRGGSYQVGPLARFNLNYEKLTPAARQAAARAKIAPGCRNPFRSIIVRCVETLYACEEALRIIRALAPPEAPAVEVRPRAGTGHGCTEAPRGILYHRYRISETGEILDAKIVPPTAQNQRTIEGDLWHFVEQSLDQPDAVLQRQCEQAIRNYDPCISCSAHFLNLKVERT